MSKAAVTFVTMGIALVVAALWMVSRSSGLEAVGWGIAASLVAGMAGEVIGHEHEDHMRATIQRDLSR